MSKRIVVGLDPSEYTRKALEVACLRAALSEGTVVGVGFVDVPGIERSVLGAGAGASHYAKTGRQLHIREAERVVRGLLEAFEAQCKERGVRCEHELRFCSPVDALIDAARSADVIVIGARTFFHFETRNASDRDTLRRLVRARACPVMTVPLDFDPARVNVLFPYDASPASVRAMRLFNYLTRQVPPTRRVTLLSVHDDPEEGGRLLDRPTAYLEAHGYEVARRVETGDPRRVVLAVAHELRPVVVALGAHGHGSGAERPMGGVTKALIRDGTVPLFLSV